MLSHHHSWGTREAVPARQMVPIAPVFVHLCAFRSEFLPHFRRPSARRPRVSSIESAHQRRRRMLEQVFVSFSKRLPLEPRERAEQLMSFGAWMEFLRACGAAEFGCDADDGGIACASSRGQTRAVGKAAEHPCTQLALAPRPAPGAGGGPPGAGSSAMDTDGEEAESWASPRIKHARNH